MLNPKLILSPDRFKRGIWDGIYIKVIKNLNSIENSGLYLINFIIKCNVIILKYYPPTESHHHTPGTGWRILGFVFGKGGMWQFLPGAGV